MASANHQIDCHVFFASTISFRRKEMDAAILDTVNSTLAEFHSIYNIAVEKFPGAAIVLRYVQNSYQNDPFRIVLEVFLLIFAFKYLLSKKYAPDSQELRLTDKVYAPAVLCKPGSLISVFRKWIS
eukprot:Partr_v1_DN26194_c0_g1_i2_m10333